MDPRFFSSFARWRYLETLSLGEFLERTIFLHLVDGVHFLDGLADGREVGEHSTRPALGHGRHVDGGSLLGDDVLSLFLGGNEEDFAAAAGHLLEHFRCLVDLHDGLVQVDDVDSVLLVEDVRSHFRVPLAGKVSEVCACIKQFLEISSGHNVFKVLFCFSLSSIRSSAFRRSPQFYRSLGNPFCSSGRFSSSPGSQDLSNRTVQKVNQSVQFA